MMALTGLMVGMGILGLVVVWASAVGYGSNGS